VALQKERDQLLRENQGLKQQKQFLLKWRQEDTREKGRLRQQNHELEHQKKDAVQRNQELEHQTDIAVQEKNEAVQETHELRQENHELKQENHELKQQKDEAVQENWQHEGLLEEMRSKVECPVCLAVPRAGPVPMCPGDPFLCSRCKAVRERAGRRDCPSCRGPMGEARSLLATLVIENVKHECEHMDCEVRMDFKEYKRHQEACDFRPVRCPGFDKLMAFWDVKQHVVQCTGIDVVLLPVISFVLSDAELSDNPKDVIWQTSSFEFDSKSFFLQQQKNKRGGIYLAKVVMLGNQEQCDEYITEISFLNQNSRPIFRPEMSLDPKF
jgi:hypothetical protein